MLDLNLFDKLRIFQKETIETYDLNIPTQRIIECRIRQSFKLLKQNYQKYNENKIKLCIQLLPDIYITYIICNHNNYKEIDSKQFDEEYENKKQIKIKLKAPFYIINYLKQEYLKNLTYFEKSKTIIKADENQDLLLYIEKIIIFIKEMMFSDRLLQIICNAFKNYDELDFKSPKIYDFIDKNHNLWLSLKKLSISSWYR